MAIEWKLYTLYYKIVFFDERKGSGAGMKYIHIIFNVMLRLVFGALGIYILNSIFAHMDFNIMVGINLETMAVIGLLGAPGFVMLYGIIFYKYMY